MKRLLLYGFLLVVLAFGCDTNPVIHGLVLSDLSDITYQQIDYNLFSIHHSSTTNEVIVAAVVVGELDSSAFKVKDSIVAVYTPSGNAYMLAFQTSVPTTPTKSLVTLRTRYYFSNGAWTNYDTTLSSLKYPYPGTELVVTKTGGYFAEDIDISDSVLYGQINDYILIYDLKTLTTSLSILVGSYECLTVVDNRYIIYDHSSWPLYKFHLVTNSIEMFVYHPVGRFLLGLESYNGYIYELLQEQSSPDRISLLKYTTSGTLVDSIAIDHYVCRLTIHDDIAYFQRGAENARIERFDLSTETFLEEFKPPSSIYEGIRIRNGYFYFSDFSKRTIARFPLEQLFIYGSIQ